MPTCTIVYWNQAVATEGLYLICKFHSFFNQNNQQDGTIYSCVHIKIEQTTHLILQVGHSCFSWIGTSSVQGKWNTRNTSKIFVEYEALKYS